MKNSKIPTTYLKLGKILMPKLLIANEQNLLFSVDRKFMFLKLLSDEFEVSELKIKLHYTLCLLDRDF